MLSTFKKRRSPEKSEELEKFIETITPRSEVTFLKKVVLSGFFR